MKKPTTTMTTTDTTEIYNSRLPQETPDDSPYLSSDLSNRHFQADQNPLHQAKMEGCDVLYYIYQDHGNGSAKIR